MKPMFLISAVYFACELAVRWIVRLCLAPGETVHVFAKLYVTNALHPMETRALGINSVGWMLIALALTGAMCSIYVFAGVYMRPFASMSTYWIGCYGATLVFATAVMNLFELLLQDGVTDYIAVVDLASKHGYIVNLGDVVSAIGVVMLAVSFVGMPLMLPSAQARSSA